MVLWLFLRVTVAVVRFWYLDHPRGYAMRLQFRTDCLSISEPVHLPLNNKLQLAAQRRCPDAADHVTEDSDLNIGLRMDRQPVARNDPAQRFRDNNDIAVASALQK